MSQREFEEQPEAPDLGEVAQEPTGETLVGPPDSDVLDAGYVPPDRPYVTDDPATLARNRDLDARLGEERPDVPSDATPPPGDASREPATNMPASTDREADRAPRLTAAESTPDTRYTENLEAEDVGVDGGAAGAEEAAMHVRDENDAAPSDETSDAQFDSDAALEDQRAAFRDNPMFSEER